MANELPLLNPLLQSNLDSDGFSINNLGGLTMTAGFATLFQNPTDPMHAATKDYADSIGGTALPDDTHAVYVSKVGNDADSGLNAGEPKLTIGSAVTAASTLLGLGALGVKVVVIDGGAYTENVSLPDLVVLEAAGAVLIGTLALASRSSAYLDRHFASADNQDLVSKTGGSGHGFYHCNILDQRGIAGTLTGGRGLVNSSTGSILFAMVGVLFVAASGEGVRDNGAGNGHIHFWTPDLYLAGNNAIGIRAQTPNSNFIGYIDHILKFGTPTGTVGISVTNAGASVRATITELIADTAYNITAGALYLQSVNVVGTRTGTPVWEWHNQAILPVAKGGMLAGGTIGQVLTKASGADFDLVWAAGGGGGGPTAGRGIVVAGTDVHFAQNADYTANRIPFATSTTAIGFSADLTFDAAVPALIAGVSGGATKLLVNPSVTTPSLALWAVWTPTLTSGNHWASNTQISANPSAATSGQYRGHECLANNLTGNNQNFTGQLAGGYFQGSLTGSGTGADLRGIIGRANHTGTGTVASAIGVEGSVYRQTGAGTISVATCVLADCLRNAGTLTIAFGFRHTHSGDAGAVYGLFLTTPTGTITNRWGIYQEGAAERNYFAGAIKLGDNDTITANRPFDLVYTTAVTSGTVTSMWMGAELMPSGASATFHNGGYFYLRPGNAQNYSNPHYVLTGQYLHNGSGTVASARGVRGEIIKLTTGPITEAMALYGRVQNSNATGAITNGYALYLEASVATGTITNRWGVYQAGAADTNFLAGPLVIGSGAPSAGSSIVTRRTISANTGWGAAFVNSAARTTNGTLSCIGSYTVVNTTGLTANITGEHTALIGLCAHYINPGHATATRTVNLMQGLVIRSQHATGAGALTTMIGLDIRPEFAAAAGTTTAYQILLRERTGTNVTNYWGIYQEDVVARNYFAGRTRIGTTTDWASSMLWTAKSGVNHLVVEDTAAIADRRKFSLRVEAGIMQLGVVNDALLAYADAIQINHQQRVTIGNRSLDPSLFPASLRIGLETTSTTEDPRSMLLSVLANPGASTARTYYGIEAVCTSAIANAQNFTNSTFGGIVAVYVDGQHNGTGTVTRLLGTKTRVAKVSTGPVTNMFAVEAILGNYNATGAVTNAYGVFVPTPILTGSITNVYGLYIEALAGTNKWGVYQAGATDSNYLAGRLGVGINTFPTMTGVGIALGNLSVAPSTNPASGGVLYSEAGALKWRGSGGTVTTIAPA